MRIFKRFFVLKFFIDVQSRSQSRSDSDEMVAAEFFGFQRGAKRSGSELVQIVREVLVVSAE